MTRDGTAARGNKYVLFTLNTQEFLLVEQGIATVRRLLDLHERYQVPLDIFLTNPAYKLWETSYPDLLRRITTSKQVSVSYHVRPPAPYYKNYDFLGLAEMPPAELRQTLLDYEQHGLDLNTGLPTSEPGGYTHFKQLVGYPPRAVGMQCDVSVICETLAQILLELGARFTVKHQSGDSEGESCTAYRPAEQFGLGEKQYGLYIKPEDVEVKLFNCGGMTPQQVIRDSFAHYTDDHSRFLVIKMHDNDFYATASSWTTVYLRRMKELGPDFDYQSYADDMVLLSPEEAEAMWTLYEQMLKYARQHEEYTLVNLADVEKML